MFHDPSAHDASTPTLLVHARDGIIDPKTKRISEQDYHPIGRLFGNRYCTTRQRFNLPGDLPVSKKRGA